ncbi:MAG: fatty acid desaturase [Saprospiraceae bacterium]|nr:fatty acid desaturase [Saprospiraceae bacterium]
MDYKKEQLDDSVLQRLPLIVKAYQLPDARKATAQVLTSFLPFVAIWVAMYLLRDVSFWLVISLAALNAFFLVRIFIIQHDCGHQSFTASRKANNIIGEICSLLSFMPYQYWAKSHNFHHGHNGLLWEHRDIGDIDLLTVNEFNQLSAWGKMKYRIFRSVPVLFVLGPAWYILIHSRLPLINMKGWEHARRSLIKHNLLLIAVHLSVVLLLGYEAFLKVHLPILIFFGIIAVWFFYVQHQHETAYKQWKDRWEYIRSAVQGSTYYNLPKLFHWFTGNIGYHHIHHLNPLVPNYELARCHHENPILQKVANSITFTESLKCVFHKLWDEDQQRMITFREYRMRMQQQKQPS